MTYDRHAVRALTLADNFAWLRSFGCTIEERAGMTLIDHPLLPEYEAWLFTRASQEAVAQLRRVASSGAEGIHTIYIDDDIATDEVRDIVSGARCDGRNVTVATQLAMRGWTSPVTLQAAKADEWAAWADLYSRGFARHELAEVDRIRWRLAFSAQNVEHWFFVDGGERTGVCQTTSGPLHGIYSFTLLPEARGVRAAFHALRALLGHLAGQPSRWIYFEVLNQSPLARTRVQPVIGLKRVRSLTGYTLQG